MAQQDYVYAQLGQKAVKNEYSGGVTDSATVFVNNEDNTIYVYSHATIGNVRQVVEQVISEELNVTDIPVSHQFVTAVNETSGVISITRAALSKSDLPTLGIADINGLAAALASKLGTDVIVDNLVTDDSTKVLSAKQGKVLNDTKQNLLDSGVNIKTINSNSILGPGNIDIASNWGSIGGTLSKQTDLQGALNAKQETLIGTQTTGQNIKTINNTTLLGSGNIDLSLDEDNVIFKQNFQTNYTLGKYNGTIANAVTIPAANKSIKQVLEDIFTITVNPTITQPSVGGGITNTFTTYEVGTTVTPTYSFSFNAGSYEFGPNTDVTVSLWSLLDTNGNTSSSSSGSFAPFIIDDNEEYSITATATHTQGAIPFNNKGTGVPELRIAAGDKTHTSGVKITGYRQIFYGYANTAVPTSAIIRNLVNQKANSPLVNALLSESTSSKAIIIAAPKDTRTMVSVTMPSSSEADVTSQFIKQPNSISVEGANGYTAIDYDVWVYNPASMAGTYKINMN